MTMERLEMLRHQNMDERGFGPRAMMRIKVCQNCGSVGASAQLFCKICGGRLPKHSLYQRYKAYHRSCSLCGTVVSEGARYCPQCGEKIKGIAVR